MIVLAFDTALAACSVAIWRDGAVLAHRSKRIARGHSEILMPMIHETMASTAIDFDALDRIGVATGPGSFTGIRIGLAAAQGFGLAASLPLVGVTTLEAVAEAAIPRNSEKRSILVALDAGRPDLFAQIFAGNGKPLTTAQALSPGDVASIIPEKKLLVVGNGGSRLHAALAGIDAIFDSDLAFPDAAEVAAIASRREPVPAVPFYIHPSYAKPIGIRFASPELRDREPK